MGHSVFDSLRLYVSKDTYTLVQEGDQPDAQTLIIQRKANEISVVDGSKPPNGGYEKAFQVYGLMGIISLYNCDYIIFITGRKQVARLFDTDVYLANDFAVYPIEPTPSGTAAWLLEGNKQEKTLLELLKGHLYGGPYYFTYGEYDLTSRLQVQSGADRSQPLWKRTDDRFFYNRHLQSRLINEASKPNGPKVDRFILPIIQGFFEVRQVSINGHDFLFGLASRRSRHRAGTRYFRRGTDKNGNVANFNETEMIVSINGGRTYFSHVQTRGSVPLFWSELSNLRYKPDLQVRDVPETAEAFSLHMNHQIETYGDQYLINLVNKSGYEQAVKEGFEKAVETMGSSKVHYIYFDFHHECRGLRFDRVSKLLDQLDQDLHQQGYFYSDGRNAKNTQKSAFRTNCMDCLDRTNVVQSQIAKWMLTQQLREAGVLKGKEGIDDHKDFNFVYRNVWADNADIVSKAYSGTGALKTDFTRTGKRTKMGAAQDGWNSAKRYFKNNFGDGPRQDSYDLFLGVWQPKKGDDNVFADNRSAITKLAPTLLYIALSLIITALLFPSLHQQIFGDNRAIALLWLVCASTSMAYISAHGVEYVAWPRLSPQHYEAFAYRGPGHESGKRGRSGYHIPDPSSGAGAVRKAKGEEKKRLE